MKGNIVRNQWAEVNRASSICSDFCAAVWQMFCLGRTVIFRVDAILNCVVPRLRDVVAIMIDQNPIQSCVVRRMSAVNALMNNADTIISDGNTILTEADAIMGNENAIMSHREAILSEANGLMIRADTMMFPADAVRFDRDVL